MNAPHPEPARGDDTTRYLCAAAHMDPASADGAIREFLVEPARPVPSSPGVDAAAVLAEAVAARTRRKLRDLAVVLLLAGLVHLLSVLRPLPQDRGVVNPGMYGSAASLRELAADPDVHNYCQLADVDRYVKMLEGRLIRAAGYSPASFDARAAAVVNNNVQIAGSVGGSVVIGSDNKVGDTAAAPRPTE